MDTPAIMTRQFIYLLIFLMVPHVGWTQTVHERYDDPIGLEWTVLGGSAGWGDIRSLQYARFERGWRGGEDVVLSDRGESVNPQTDLLARFDQGVDDFSGSYRYGTSKGVRHTTNITRFGDGAVGFDGLGSLSLYPTTGSIFTPYSQPGAFIIDLWLYPGRVSEGATVLSWQGALVNDQTPVLQEIRFEVNAGRFRWVLRNLVSRVDESGIREMGSVNLSARRGPVPRRWTHHRLRYDPRRGQLAYLVDGVAEAISYITESGEEDFQNHTLLVGSDTGEGLVLGRGYHGLIDELRIDRTYDAPLRTARYRSDPGEIVTAPVPLGNHGGSVYAIKPRIVTPGNTDVRLYYRVGDHPENEPWSEVPESGLIDRPIGGVAETAGNEGSTVLASWDDEVASGIDDRGSTTDVDAGRFIQFRGVLYGDASRSHSPRLQEIEVAYRPFSPPPVPRGVNGVSVPGGVHISWNESLSGTIEDYHVLIGERPGRYFGTDGVASPLSTGGANEITIGGLEPGRSYVFVVEGIDRHGLRSALSREIEVRAGRRDG